MATHNQYIPQSIPHPGRTLAEKLEEIGVGPKEFAVRTGKPEKTIIAVLKGDSSITSDMAILFENVTRIPASYWLEHQKRYDEFMARERHKEVIAAACDWARMFPIREMTKLGWIPSLKTIQEKTEALLAFFGVASPRSWEDYFLNQELKVAFRISLASTSQPYAISAWLRMGEIQAAELNVNPYSDQSFKAILPDLKDLMVEQPPDFFQKMQSLCAKAGVKVVHTPCLPKAPLNGATRWLNDTPLIQLTGRYKRNDILWFTFFHEAGHIIKHGKKDIFLEDVEYSDLDRKKEDEADAFAKEWTLSAEQEAEILKALPLNDEQIFFFAQKFNTHPGMIVGRMQFLKVCGQAFGRKFFIPVQFDQD